MLSAAGLVSVCVALRLTATITAIRSPIFGNRAKRLVPRVGFEPTAYRLRSGCSTAELSGLYRLQPVPAYYPIVGPEPSGSAGRAGATRGSGASTAGSISGPGPVAG